jgi:hypothetical protein
MLTVNFVLKNNPSNLTLVFKAHKNAEDAYNKASAFPNTALLFEDDYGLKLAIDMGDVASITFSEYANDMDKNMDLQIIQHKSQLKAQARAKQDMTLHMLEKQATPIIHTN